MEQSSNYKDGAPSETDQHPFSRIGNAGMPGEDKSWVLGRQCQPSSEAKEIQSTVIAPHMCRGVPGLQPEDHEDQRPPWVKQFDV